MTQIMSPISEAKEKIILHAEEKYALYPSHRGFWRDPKWKLMKLHKKVINLKHGLAFDYGDITIGRIERSSSFPVIGGVRWMMAYSLRLGRQVFIRQGDVEWLEE